MLTFTLTGTIGCVLPTASGELTLAITSVLDIEREPLRLAWITCVARDPSVCAQIQDCLLEGDNVRIEGKIERRRRQVGELAFYSVGFVIGSIERVSAPLEGVTS